MKRTFTLALVAAVAACSTPRSNGAHDTLIFNGRIYLGAPDWTAVEALHVRDGRVLAAGDERGVRAGLAGRDVALLDLGGATALPGLQDAHGHVEGYGDALETVDLRGAASFAEVVERVRARAATTPAGTWIRGRGWDQNLWPAREFPRHDELSAATPSHPVLLTRVDGHALLANAAALTLAGVDREFASEQVGAGGRVLLGADRRPTGVFVDEAMELVERALPAADEATRERRILAAQAQLLALGLTCVHDMGISRAGIATLERLRDEGKLRLRFVEYLSGGAQLAESDLRGLPLAPDADGRLAVVGVKLYADGALGSRGAALLEPYADEPAHSGLTMLSPEELARVVALCAEHGLQPAVHAIGDRANREVLDAYAARCALDPAFAALRPRIEHAQVVARADWPRFAALGVIASMQPTHATSDMPWAPRRLGSERIAGAYAWRRLAGAPQELAFGSDFPVESPDPLAGLYAAITCSALDGEPPEGFRPDQRLSAREALGAFTWGAARAARQEASRGRLAPGYGADLTVLDRDPLRCAPRELLAARVLLTIVDGEVVYRAP